MRTLVIADTHFPWPHPRYLEFILDTAEEYKCDEFVHIGDVVELHSMSFHQHDPDMPSPSQELDMAQQHIDLWKECIPDMLVCQGNHDERVKRVAFSAGIPARCLRSYTELFDTPGWEWGDKHYVDGVKYIHGTGRSGIYAVKHRMMDDRRSVVQGHTHVGANIFSHANDEDTIFGMNVGCGLDIRSQAQMYGRHYTSRPMLACGVVVDGVQPHLLYMDAGGKYKRRTSAGRDSWKEGLTL